MIFLLLGFCHGNDLVFLYFCQASADGGGIFLLFLAFVTFAFDGFVNSGHPFLNFFTFCEDSAFGRHVLFLMDCHC